MTANDSNTDSLFYTGAIICFIAALDSRRDEEQRFSNLTFPRRAEERKPTRNGSCESRKAAERQHLD